MSKDQKEIHNMMKVFARYNSQEDHDTLVDGILMEKNIRQRIQELQQNQQKIQNLSSDKEVSIQESSLSNADIIGQQTRARQSKQLRMKTKEEEKELEFHR